MFTKSLFRRISSPFRAIPTEIYVFLVALLYRLPALGYDYINNDVFLWKARGYAFGSALSSLNFAGTAVTYHPGVPLLWCEFIAIKIYSILSKAGFYTNLSGKDEFLANNYLQVLVVVILTSFLITIAYSQLKRIVGFKIALLATTLVLLEPFFIGLARALHTDVMISLFMFIAVLFFYNGIFSNNKKPLSKDLIFSGVFAGLALLTKSSALFLVPFFFLISIIYFYKFKDSTIIKKLLVALGFAVLTFFVVWPAMWVTPLESLNLYLFKGVEGIAIEEGHQHYWFGQYTDDPGLLFYPIVLIGRYSMVLIAFFIVSLYFIFTNRAKLFKKEKNDLFLVLLLFSVFYFLMLSIVSKKLDRYSLPILFPISVLAAWAILKSFNRKLAGWLIAGFIFLRILLFYGIHPNYLAYYSPAIGGLEGGRDIIEPKWLIGYDKVAKYFNDKQAGQKTPIKVAIADFDYLRPYANFEVLNITNEPERNNADYFVLPVYRSERNRFYTDTYTLTKPNDMISIAGVDYYYIYKINKKK